MRNCISLQNADADINLFEMKYFKELISFLASGILGFVFISYLMSTFYFVGVNVGKII